jgi:hypothetical protein
LAVLVCAAALVLAGKPTSLPLEVAGISPYVEEVVFAESSIPTIFSSWSDSDMERVEFQGNSDGAASCLAVDSSGIIYTLVRALSATRISANGPHKTQFYGIVAYDPASSTGETVVQESLVYPDTFSTYNPDDYEGQYFVSVAVVPADAGPLVEGRLLVLRRGYENGNRTVDLIQIDPANGDTDLLYQLDGTTILDSLQGHLHADTSGNLYLAARSYQYGSGDDGDGALLKITWDGTDYSEENLVPSSLSIDTVVSVDPDGDVYTIGAPFGANDGEILRYDATSGTFELHATYPQESRKNLVNETSWGFAWDSAGQLWMGIYDFSRGYSGVAAVEANAEVDFGSRIADIPYRDRAGLAAGLNEDLYVIAADSQIIDGTRQATWSLYRLKKTGDSGGGGGGGGGKGKNK